MNDEQIEDYAHDLIYANFQNIEWLTIFEMAEDYLEEGEISEEDAHKVDKAIRRADIEIHF